ncbi:hypothetical protein LUS21_000495 [Salmonella enterica]|uniref:Histidinol-phosphatase n=1 Tax=Salmonella enterica subsp. enterica serovar Strasbourg TaxID=682796 RepID=A0A5X7JWN8_SALET|nr:histidinol phosphate phosphatase [Salmonella enterica]EBX5861914.1 hypothetical protein [Salmonella enterica subsp. enterica serovar Kingston]ECA7539401.1 hypothetical protein [Salmonella enterica subsp. enterica serovar Strasbourg]ECB6308712.1 hypothetical protein [Salmonella enterica subsp. enterica serovar Chailey]ECG7887487.1 hypothetical protein [Salmonella enterica subsp. enterica serovar Takoradi]EDR9795123.1 hypothetical protein [Salmonella enterica subsp. enterica serovar Zongo]ED
MQTTPDIKYFHQLASLAEYRLLNPQITTPLCHTQDLLGEIKEEILSLFPQHSVNTGAAPFETKKSAWTIRQFHSHIDDIPVSGIFIGFTENEKNGMCMLTNPFTRERFWSDGIRSRAFGPFGEYDLATRRNTRLHQAVIHISTDFSVQDSSTGKIRQQALLTRKGDPFYAMGMLAAGYIDACIINPSAVQEFMPFIHLIENAGGVFSILREYCDGSGNMLIASGSRELHNEVMNVLTAA